MHWLVALFIGLPIAEIAVLLEVGEILGLWRTIGVIVITAVVGASMWKTQGLNVLWQIRSELAKNTLPAESMLDGVIVLAGGLFLLTPGFITDIAGFAFLIPQSRGFIRDYLKRWIKRKMESGEIQVYISSEHDL